MGEGGLWKNLYLIPDFYGLYYKLKSGHKIVFGNLNTNFKKILQIPIFLMIWVLSIVFPQK